jgi:predicted XRE-type DNA-binding protein
MRKLNPEKPTRVKTADDLGEALGLSAAETAEMEFRSELTCILTKIIRDGSLTHAEIARRGGTSRTRVTAVANGNTRGISTDLLIRVLSATGHKAELRVRKAAALRTLAGQ